MIGRYIGLLLGSVYELDDPAVDLILYTTEEHEWQEEAREAFYDGAFNKISATLKASQIHQKNPGIREEALKKITELCGKVVEWKESPRFGELDDGYNCAVAYARKLNEKLNSYGIVAIVHYCFIFTHLDPGRNWYDIQFQIWEKDITPTKALKIIRKIR